jgi:UDP-N-acetylmuramoyl-tripeptide--D-alanyl-D-alanine ligase
MAPLRLSEIAAATAGSILRGDDGTVFASFGIDSRTIEPGGLFFAVVAERDGHDFVAAAATRGAAGAVVSRNVAPPHPSFALLKVRDTVAALQDLARAVLAARPVKVVGITGSVGKTTTKEFTAALLGPSFRVLKSEANLNNHLGLALSILKIEKNHEVAVLEMGMSAPGEIRKLTGIAPPDVAVVTNVAPVHLEFLGTLEAVAAAKAEILDGSKPGGTAVLNADDPWVRTFVRRAGGPVVRFGFGEDAEIRASDLVFLGLDGLRFRLGYDGADRDVRLPFLTDSHVRNLLAALGVARAFGLPWERLEKAVAGLGPTTKRGTILRLSAGITVIDDSYNSSPLALESALRGYAHLPARRRIAVLGEMLELGPEAPRYHEIAGRQAYNFGWDIVAAVGPLARTITKGARAEGLAASGILEFATSAEAADALPELIAPGDLVLVKGSRGVRMERIVERLSAVFKEN